MHPDREVRRVDHPCEFGRAPAFEEVTADRHQTDHGMVYIKLTVLDGVLVVSFKEL